MQSTRYLHENQANRKCIFILYLFLAFIFLFFHQHSHTSTESFTMLMCHARSCTCPQHRFLDCLKKEQNDEAKLTVLQIENLSELRDKSGLTLLHYSVKYCNAEMTQCLIDEGCDVNAEDDSGIIPLMIAVKASDVKTTKVLMESKADVYAADCDGTNSLQLAFYLCLSTSSHALKPNFNPHLILKMLFDKVNTDFKKGTLAGITVFKSTDLVKFAIAVFGNTEITRFILDNRYQVNFREPERGSTALHCAIRMARFDNADMLMDYGADINALDNDGCSPLREYTSYFEGTLKFEDVDKKSEVLKCFLRYSTRLSMCHARGGFTELERLLVYGKKKTVKTVFQSSVDVRSCIRKGKSLLSMFIHNKDVSVIDLLDELEIEFDPNERIDKFTPLIESVIVKCPKKVEFFLKHGADVNMTDYTPFKGRPLSHAMILSIKNSDEENNVAKIIELLLQYGAAGVQTFFCESQEDSFCLPTKIIIAHLALLGAVEQPSLTDLSRRIIESTPQLKKYFDLCTKQLEYMKNLKMSGTTTLFKLLTESEESVVVHARNYELVSSWNNVMGNLSNFEVYYVNALQRRHVKLLGEAKFVEKATLVVEALTGLCVDLYRVVLYKVIGYLDRKDLLNLCEVKIALR